MKTPERRKRKSFLLDDDNDQKKSSEAIYTTQDSKTLSNKYRAVQINSTKIEDEIRSHSELKKQYEIILNKSGNNASVSLSDLYYEFKPPVMNKVYEFVSATEYIRNNVKFNLDKNGRLRNISNKEELFQNWTEFKKKDLKTIDFITSLKKDNKSQYDQILKEGDQQFSTSNNLMELDYQRDLLYMILFDKHITAPNLSNIAPEEYIYTSQLFPRVKVPMTIRYDVIEDNDNFITIRKVADSILNEKLLKEIEEQYNTLHKPLIKYSFTEYKLTFRTRYTVDKNTRIINDADLTIIEDIEHTTYCLAKPTSNS